MSETKRELWASRVEYLLACIGSAVGFGNFWRFPYLCYRNGGGAFLLPYLTCILVAGVPMLFLESALGQLTRRGPVGSWNICPVMKGLGVCTAIYAYLQSIYYIIIMTWVVYYFIASFYPDIPWAHCRHDWNSDNCLDSLANTTSVGSRTSVENYTSHLTNLTNQDSAANTSTNTHGRDPASEFWRRGVLEMSDGIETQGHVCLHLLASLAVIWVASYFCMWKGIRWTGKVVYFTATFPYVLLLIFLVQGALQTGAGDGLVYYLQPSIEALINPQVWFEAASQVLFTYAVALGIWSAFSSYCPFNSNCYRNSMIVAMVNSGTSFLSGFVVFTTLGQMAHALKQSVHSVATSGPGLAFVVYPRAITLLPVPHVWAVLFFFMLLLVGIDSQIGLMEAVLTALLDASPVRFRKREWLLALYCVSSFLLGICMITQGGMYVFQLVDYYLFGAFIPQVVCLLEVVTVAWLYGVNQFYDNITSMIGYKIGPWMKVSWRFLTPLFLLIIMVGQIATFSPLTYDKTYVYPGWANTLGFIMTFAVIAIIPAYSVIVLVRSRGGLRERFQETTRSTIACSAVPTYDHELEVVYDSENGPETTTLNVG